MFEHHQTYQRMYKEGELKLDLHIPLENFQSKTPTMANQVELAHAITNRSFVHSLCLCISI